MFLLGFTTTRMSTTLIRQRICLLCRRKAICAWNEVMITGMPQDSDASSLHAQELIAHLDADVHVRIVYKLLLVCEGQEADLVQRVCSVGDELPQKDLLQVIATRIEDLNHA